MVWASAHPVDGAEGLLVVPSGLGLAPELTERVGSSKQAPHDQVTPTSQEAQASADGK